MKKRDIPSESTFSRAFAEFTKTDLGAKVHKALIEKHLKDQRIGHIDGMPPPSWAVRSPSGKEGRQRMHTPRNGEDQR
ncbi:MAG: hypothetical protein NTU90_08185 [Proteobacteria bacterium]|nr:hypothetical protein [Pseudomonadota bacterium]